MKSSQSQYKVRQVWLGLTRPASAINISGVKHPLTANAKQMQLRQSRLTLSEMSGQQRASTAGVHSANCRLGGKDKTDK